jgi:hypothetical protein
MVQSEVRIRHREESKNVTRLTMENVSRSDARLFDCFPSFVSLIVLSNLSP